MLIKSVFTTLFILLCTIIFTASCKKNVNDDSNSNTPDLSARYFIATPVLFPNSSNPSGYLVVETLENTVNGKVPALSYHSSLVNVTGDTMYAWTVEKLSNGFYAIYKIGHNINTKERVYLSLGEKNNPLYPEVTRLTIRYQKELPNRQPGAAQQFKLAKDDATRLLTLHSSDGQQPMFMTGITVKNGKTTLYWLFGLFMHKTPPDCKWELLRGIDSVRYCFVEGLNIRKL